MTALRDDLTAEAVAWICIGVDLCSIALIVDSVGIRERLHKEQLQGLHLLSLWLSWWMASLRQRYQEAIQVLELLREQVVEKKDREMDEDLQDAGVPLEEFSDEDSVED